MFGRFFRGSDDEPQPRILRPGDHLSPDDVVNQKFQHVKFTDGYDQDEVDDFLDLVVETMRADRRRIAELEALLGGEDHQRRS